MEQQTKLINTYPWKTLLILDACRYDYFKELNDISGTLKCVRSPSSDSPNWVEHVIKPRPSWGDTVLICGQPFIGKYAARFYAHRDSFLDDWDRDRECIAALDMNPHIIQFAKNHPDKRVMVWYMQPHFPYLGKKHIIWRDLRRPDFSRNKAGRVYWKEVKSGIRSIEEAKEAYRDNIIYVLNAIKEILPYVPKPVIITADHGETWGVDDVWGHNPAKDIPDLRNIPWFEVEATL